MLLDVADDETSLYRRRSSLRVCRLSCSGVILGAMADEKRRVEVSIADPHPAVSDRGVDLTLIRSLLKLTPAERLRVGVASSKALFDFAARARRIK